MATKYSKQSQNIFLILICLFFAVMVFFVVGGIFSLIVSSLILSYFLFPIHSFYLKKFKNARLSSLLTLATATVGIFIPFALLSYFLILSLIRITVQYKVYIENPQAINLIIQEFLSKFSSSTIFSSVDFSEVIQVFVKFVIDTSRSFFSSIPLTIISFFIVMFLSYYVLVYNKEMIVALNDYIPLSLRKQNEILRKIEKNLQVLFKGYFLTGIIQTFVALIGYLIFGVPNVLILTFITFIISLIPYIGTPLVWVPVSFYLVLTGDVFNGVGLLIYGTFIISMIDNFVRPILMSDKETISAPLVFVGFVGGLIGFGISGIILGPMIISIASILFGYLRELYIIEKK